MYLGIMCNIICVDKKSQLRHIFSNKNINENLEGCNDGKENNL